MACGGGSLRLLVFALLNACFEDAECACLNVTVGFRDDDAMREFMSVRASVIDEQAKMKKAAAGQSAAAASAAESAASPAADAPPAHVTIDRVNRAAAAAKFCELLLDHEYMQRLGFPGFAASPPDGQVWACSPAREAASATSWRPAVAIDCEMVITSGGAQELARLTAVDAHGCVLLDMLVVPDAPVVNYNTQFSGITKELLRGAC